MSSKKMVVLAVVLTAILTAVYWNHFDNGFYFDDIHTIVNNEYIRSLEHVPEFFTNIETFGTMPTNRGYRPMVTLQNAIDYRLAGNKLDPMFFHLSIYFWYLVQGVLLYILFLNIFKKVIPDHDFRMVSLLSVTFYMFHAANSETINYIIARSDSFSTVCMAGSLVLYQNQRTRKWLLYLFPFIIGMLTKEVTLMLVPIIMLYHLLFEEDFTLRDLRSSSIFKKGVRSIAAAIPMIVVGIGLIAFNLGYMNNPDKLSTGIAHPRLDYFTSQFVVVVHYIANFILPLDLSADPDFKVTADIFTAKKIFSFLVIALLHAIALFCMTKRKYLPIAFGILWFFISLIPTSTFNPLTQVSNDHRTFLPYIGLCLATGWAIYLLYSRLSESKKNTGLLKPIFMTVLLLTMVGHSCGIYLRNEIWESNETLWFDAVQKGPTNGRAQMNYGLEKMRKGEYPEAEKYFTKALELLPYWPYTNINMAVLKDAMGKKEEAVKYFELALRYGSDNPEPYYYYARFAVKNKDTDKAMLLLEAGHNVSPKHGKINELREQLRLLGVSPEEKLKAQIKLVESNPTADNYINLSLAQYQAKDYKGCIASCRKALDINPRSAIAYNNICSANNAMQNWKEAAIACQKALEIDPNFERARNNLNWALNSIKRE